jgi:hypothetical protein
MPGPIKTPLTLRSHPAQAGNRVQGIVGRTDTPLSVSVAPGRRTAHNGLETQDLASDFDK